MINDRQLQALVRSLGGRVENIKANKVTIHRQDRDISLINPTITKIIVNNKVSYIINCDREELEPKDDELELIINIKGVTKEQAYDMFKKANGDLSKILGD